MYQLTTDRDFDRWRDLARQMLAGQISPPQILWLDREDEPSLLSNTALTPPVSSQPAAQTRVPREYLDLASKVACHRDPDRWNLLYRTLWRLTHGEPELLERVTDDDVYQLGDGRRPPRPP